MNSNNNVKLIYLMNNAFGYMPNAILNLNIPIYVSSLLQCQNYYVRSFIQIAGYKLYVHSLYVKIITLKLIKNAN